MALIFSKLKVITVTYGWGLVNNDFYILLFREFTMAEIEHFCDPADKSYPKFSGLKDTEMLLYSACHQMDGQSATLYTIGQAVEQVSYELQSIQPHT